MTAQAQPLGEPPERSVPSVPSAVRPRPRIDGDALMLELEGEWSCLSSAVLGGGLGRIGSWLNLQVPAGYARTDPEIHLAERGASLASPLVGMMTAAEVASFTEAVEGSARALATVGVRHGLAAAGRRPRAVAPVGTINLLVLADAPLGPTGLAGALQTAVEAKAQALADAGVPASNSTGTATGTATDSVCVAARPGTERFAGPATQVGSQIARAVHAAVLAGAEADIATRGRR